MMTLEGKLSYYKDLLVELTKKEIKVRYKNSYLGYLWSIANPLFLAFIYFFVFKVITKIQMQNYTLFLISGLFVWQWINNSIIAGSNLYISNASLIKKVNFPRNFLVIALALSEGFNFLLSIPVIIFFMLIYSEVPSWNWFVYIPILLVISFVFIYSLSLLIATINLFFRDMERLVGLFLTFVFYLTPIIYPSTMVPQKYKFLLYIDPFASVIISWQTLFLHSELNLKFLILTTIYSGVFFLLSTYVYNRLKVKFAELV